MTDEAGTGGPSFYWTPEEDEFLLSAYVHAGTAEIARILERSQLSVQKRAHYLGATKLPVIAKVLSDYERGSLETLIDGEGCIYFGARKERNFPSWQARVIVGNTSRPFLEKYSEMWPARIYPYRPKASLKMNRKPAWELHWFGESLRRLLPQVRLTAKEPQRLLMLEALSIMEVKGRRRYTEEERKRLRDIDTQFRVLNLRGDGPRNGSLLQKE